MYTVDTDTDIDTKLNSSGNSRIGVHALRTNRALTVLVVLQSIDT